MESLLYCLSSSALRTDISNFKILALKIRPIPLPYWKDEFFLIRLLLTELRALLFYSSFAKSDAFRATFRQLECLKFSDRFVFLVMFWFEKYVVFKREEPRDRTDLFWIKKMLISSTFSPCFEINYYQWRFYPTARIQVKGNFFNILGAFLLAKDVLLDLTLRVKQCLSHLGKIRPNWHAGCTMFLAPMEM